MSKTALVIVDMVKDFTQPDGLVFYPENQIIVPRIAKVIEEFRKYGVLMIFMQHTYRKDKPDKNLGSMRPCCIEGSGGEEIDPLLPVNPSTDYVIRKRRYSAFFGTDLDLVLRENNIENVIIVGTKTNCCIRATVYDAHYLNYNPIVLSDCVATDSKEVNDMHLHDIRRYLGKVMTSQETEKALKEGTL